ncbi:transcriptional regulator with XRE-family HTH domain [Streptomyces olivoverticillatus]|uniref:Transcriptional regulator with XRE-family HTH domain n=1 Tax=Streptomyces olivoverticillatus TaxID=66427 RepID=A0A7W7LL32_9ACTN|nr:helix-turn-helix transcriptional regulator [Streptomyces olivoverticillatus]MBB4892210.1 transcriptional regulator with XRE-family HTH domain [Streptomyces olivoverticillatus]
MTATLGDRLGELRMRRGLTQEALADKARLSVDTVRKLEQNQRFTARMSTLNRLARALDIETSALLGPPVVLASSGGAEPPSILALRQAVTPLSDFPGLVAEEDVPPPTVAGLQSSLRSTERIRRQGELTKITAVLPTLLSDARAAVRHFTGGERAASYAVLAEAYQVAATTLTAFGKEDAAYTALERSMEAAAKSDDPHLEVIGVSTLSWIFSKQGRVADAEHVAVHMAERIEPGFRSAPVGLALWGILLLRGATAAVRRERNDVAEELLSLASAAAARIGADRLDYATPFGPTNAGVAMVNAYVDMGRPDQALTHAARIPGLASLPPTWLARHHLDRATAYAEMHRDQEATRALLTAERTAPEWMRYHGSSRHLVAELRGREARRTSPIKDLAFRLEIDG